MIFASTNEYFMMLRFLVFRQNLDIGYLLLTLCECRISFKEILFRQKQKLLRCNSEGKLNSIMKQNCIGFRKINKNLVRTPKK